jgi:hypothetical protein
LKLTKYKKVMKQYTYITLLLLLQTGFLSAQIGIGTQLPDESSILDIESKNKGVLFPRVTTSERDQILSPANALLIYNTSFQTIQVNIGTKINPNWVSIGNNQNTSAVNTLLTSGKLFVGDETNTAKEVSVSGDATLSNIGVLNINNSAVISKTLTNYTIDSGPINASNTILQAIQKLDGNQKRQEFISIDSAALDLKANISSPTFSGIVGGITASMVGLGNVNNTSDVLKPISAATQTALNLKEDKINKITDINSDPTSITKYPTVSAVKNYVDSYNPIHSIKTIETDYSAEQADYTILCNNVSAAFTITLPDPGELTGKIYVIRKIDETINVLTISPSLKLTELTEISSLNYPKTIRVQSNGRYWYVID